MQIAHLLRRLPPPPAEAPSPRAAEAAPSPAPPPPAPRRRFVFPARSTLCLSLEGTSLRALRIRRGIVETWTSQSFPPRLMRGGAVADSAGLGEIIAAALGERGLRGGRLFCALPGFQAISRVLTLPAVPRARLGGVVEREARRLMAFDPAASYFYWQLLSSRTPVRVFALATPREPLRALVEALQGAGLRPEVMDLKPLALARAVNASHAIIGNAEATSVDVVVVVGGVPEVMRSLHLGDEPLAPEYVRTRLAEELMRTISYYNDTHRENPLPAEVPVFLTGEVASSAAMGTEIARLTGRAVASLAPPLVYPADLPLASFAVNLGLALKKK